MDWEITLNFGKATINGMVTGTASGAMSGTVNGTIKSSPQQHGAFVNSSKNLRLVSGQVRIQIHRF